ncbi:uncharacterized protein Aud_002651 [Aspergillus udagawae]|uniref:Uncharacterized protein n=1 Tax=Aspergillus udagawae TaxID=91492 RepID=A0A8E0QKZ8_9EURO|nr:uncharacterized protein Aud_002651 [Aspergillus udagawae]GIC86283.1 hypothetical protein Aud_002651 [Aspergillus udagawae]
MSSLYKCTSCNELIQPTKARLSCASCVPRITLCANCYVVQNYPSQHQDDPSHAISLHAHSGFIPVPPPPPPRAQSVRSPHCPPRRRPVSVSNRDSDVPPKKPPRPTNPEPRSEEPVENTVPATPMSMKSASQGPPPETENEAEAEKAAPTIPYASRPVLQSPPLETTEPSPHPPHPHSSTSWIPLFTEDMKPSASFMRLIEELFRHLDPQRTGYLSPEAVSEYIDVCGAPPSHNIWKTSRTKNPEYGYDLADRELADHFTAYGVDFAFRPRTPPTTPVNSPLDPLSYFPPAQRAAMAAFMPATPVNSLSGGKKPMLSFRGWTDLTVCGVLLNPSASCGELNRAMQAFQLPIWREWGDIPRDMLPLAPYQPEVERVRVLLEGARLNAEQEVDAVHARLKMEQRGEQNALDLVDDRVWVYRW